MRVLLPFSVLLAVVASLAPAGTSAQTLHYQGQVGTTVASTNDQPLWLHANQFGRIDPASASGYARLGAEARTDSARTWALQAGVDLLGRASNAETLHFSELYGQVRYRFAQLRAGRRHETTSPVEGGRLSSGSLMQSRNATPLPMVVLESSRFVEVPFSKGFAAVKGRLAHGWFGNDRVVEDIYLHQKSAYLQLGHDRQIQVTYGLVHNAQWGGTSSSPSVGRLPQDLDAFWTVVKAGGGPDDTPSGEQVNSLGNHIGIHDLAVTVQRSDFELTGYHQHLFEDESGLDLKNVQDGLYGLRWAGRTGNRLVDAVQYEFLYTKDQSGPVHPPGRDNYYNNFIYRLGWSNAGALLGSPLFLFDPSEESGSPVFSSRLLAHHLGVSGHLRPTLEYRVLATWMRHSGRFRDPFPSPQAQASFLLEVRGSPFETRALEVFGAVGAETGAVFGERVGLHAGLTYRGSW